jgi:hypothetical protein
MIAEKPRGQMDTDKAHRYNRKIICPFPGLATSIGRINMSSDRITHLLNNINLLDEERDWDQFHNPKNLAMNLQVKSAKVAEHFV